MWRRLVSNRNGLGVIGLRTSMIRPSCQHQQSPVTTRNTRLTSSVCGRRFQSGGAPDLPDLGQITTVPATNLKISDVGGAWIVMGGDDLQGELNITPTGTVFFRPGGKLGHGVGKLTMTDTATGVTVFRCELEVYQYTQTSRETPAQGTTFVLAGAFATASASKSNYSTLTMDGMLQMSVPDSSTPGLTTMRHLGKLNAAKLGVGEADTYKPYVPSAALATAFQHIFPEPLHLSRTNAAATLDLSKHRVGGIPSVTYVPNYLTADDERQCLQMLQRTPKEMRNELKKRVVQEYGCTMCETCQQSFVSDDNLPPWTKTLCETLVKDHIFTPTTYPNNVRVHEYAVGHGIAPHVDGPIYVPKVAILSLQSPVLMSFYPKQVAHENVMEHYEDTFKFDGPIAKQKPIFSIILEPRSLLIFAEDAYYAYPHGISDKAEDSLLEADCGKLINPDAVPAGVTTLKRQPRVGVTIRHLLSRCNHHPERSDYFLERAHTLYHEGKTTAPPGLTHVNDDRAALGRSQSSASAAPVSPKADLRNAPTNSASFRKPHQPAFDSAAPTAAAELATRLERLENQQATLLQAVKEIQVVLAHGLQSDEKFRRDLGTIMDHLTSSVMSLQGSVDSLVAMPPKK